MSMELPGCGSCPASLTIASGHGDLFRLTARSNNGKMMMDEDGCWGLYTTPADDQIGGGLLPDRFDHDPLDLIDENGGRLLNVQR